MTLNLLQTRFWVDDETLIALDTADFAHLLNEGRLERIPLQELPAQTIALAYDASASEFDLEFGPEVELDRFLDHTRMVTYQLDPVPALELADSAPLREILLRALPEAITHLPKLPMTKRRWYESWEHWSFMGTVPTEAARAAIKHTGTFHGLAGICGCGEILCGSSYVWIKDGGAVGDRKGWQKSRSSSLPWPYCCVRDRPL